jgi:hypothetical protein
MEKFSSPEDIEPQEEPTEMPETKAVKPSGSLKRMVAKGMIAASLMTGAGAMAENAQAQDIKSGAKVEQKQLQGTASSAWAEKTVQSAKSELGQLKTKDDAEFFLKEHLNDLVREFYFPTQGTIVKMKVYDTELNVRKYDKDDGAIVMKAIKDMEAIVTQLNTKYHIDGYQNRMEQLADMEKKIADESSYAHKKQVELLEKQD